MEAKSWASLVTHCEEQELDTAQVPKHHERALDTAHDNAQHAHEPWTTFHITKTRAFTSGNTCLRKSARRAELSSRHDNVVLSPPLISNSSGWAALFAAVDNGNHPHAKTRPATTKAASVNSRRPFYRVEGRARIHASTRTQPPVSSPQEGTPPCVACGVQ